MKEAITTVSGEIFCVTEWNDKVHITLIDEQGEPIRVSVPRCACNPKKREVDDAILWSSRAHSPFSCTDSRNPGTEHRVRNPEIPAP